MIYVYLIYGVSFFILWTVLWIYHMKLGRYRLSQNLWMIGLFAISHGMSDWTTMLIELEQLQAPVFRVVSLCLLIVSFLFLIEFGIHTIGSHRNVRILSLLPLSLLVSLIVLSTLVPDKFLVGEIGARYLLGVPGGFMTFYALALQVTEIKQIPQPGLATNLKLASFSFLFYMVFTGLIVPEAHFFPASVINYRTFLSLTGIPVEIFRAVCVLVITYAMTRMLHAFEVEQAQSIIRTSVELEERVKARTGELRSLNEELGQRELQQKAILDNIPDMAWLKDGESRFIRVNAPFAASAETTPEKLTGKTDLDVRPRELAERYRADDKEVMESGVRKQVEEPFIDRDGSVRWIETVKTPVFNERGEVTGTAGVSRDVTERKRWADAISAEQSFRKAIEASVPAGIATVDLDGRQSYVNPAFCKMVGWSEQELLGAVPPFAYWPPEDAGAMLKNIRRTISGKGTLEPHEVRFMRRSGERFDVLIQTSPFTDGSGNQIGWLGSITDVTDRKRIMEALRESERRYRAITDNAIDGIITIDEKSTIVLANPAVEKIFGYTNTELTGRSLTELMPENLRERHRDAVKKYLESGKRRISWSQIELPGICKDGSEVPLEMSFGEYRVDSRTFFSGIVRDISERKKMENALRESERRRQLIMDAAPAMISYVGSDLRYQFVNRRYEEWFQRPAADFIGRHIKDFLSEERYERIEPMIRTALRGELIAYDSVLSRGGQDYYLHVAYVPHVVEEHKVPGFIALATDITDHKKAEERLQEANDKLSTVLNSITEAYYAFDSEWRIVEMNREAESILASARDVAGKVYWEQFPQNLGTEIERQYRYAIREKRAVHFEARSRINNRWYEIHAYPRAERLEVYFRDVTERKQLEEIVQHRAYHDPLTDLPNRLLFDDIVKVEVAQARRNRKKLAVLFLDLDRFKEINDTLGHDAGDQLLKQVAHRLKKSIRESDTVARIGGDEFNMVLSDIQEVDKVSAAVGKITAAFRDPYVIGDEELHVTMSVGISIYPDDSRDIETLLKFADMAMYHAKQTGKNKYEFYDRALNTRNLEHALREKRLHEALEHGELAVFYLPEIDARSRKVVGAEALLRWKHPKMGLLEPAEFLPLAEETGFIIPIGEWVLREVARQYKIWQQAGYQPICVTVNLSDRQFHQKDLAEVTRKILQEAGLEPRCLELEISERIAMRDVEFTGSHLQKLIDAGVRISLDNFGTGRLSLNQLKKLPFQKLKIDKSLIRDMPADADDRLIVEAMISLSHMMKIKASAEGVETKEQLDLLCERNCDILQGYIFSRPRPAEEFEKLLESAA